jgi:hypothetical protein
MTRQVAPVAIAGTAPAERSVDHADTQIIPHEVLPKNYPQIPLFTLKQNAAQILD